MLPTLKSSVLGGYSYFHTFLKQRPIFKSYTCKIKFIILKKLFPLCPCERSGKWTVKEK